MSRKLQQMKSRTGSALVEFALVLPVLLLLCMATTDFGRLFYHAIAVMNAGSTGSHFGAQDTAQATQSTRIENLSTADAKDITGVSATATFFCQCPDDPVTEDDETSTVDCTLAANETACGGYGFPRVVVRNQVDETFRTLGPWPGIPEITPVQGRVFMRAQ